MIRKDDESEQQIAEIMREQARFVPHVAEGEKKEPDSPVLKSEAQRRKPERQLSFTKVERQSMVAEKEPAKLRNLKSFSGVATELKLNFKLN